MEIKGKIIAVLPIKSGTSKSGKEWRSQEYVIETEGQYPKRCCFSVLGDNIKEFGIQMGEIMTIYIDIDAHEYQGRWFNAVRAWNVARANQPQQATQQPPVNNGWQPPVNAQPQAPFPPQQQAALQGKSDDLPF